MLLSGSLRLDGAPTDFLTPSGLAWAQTPCLVPILSQPTYSVPVHSATLSSGPTVICVLLMTCLD